MTPEEKELAAVAYRRSGMSWREIGKRVGADKDSLRVKLSAGRDRSKPVKSTSSGQSPKREAK